MKTLRLSAAVGALVGITLMIPAVAATQVRVEKNVIYGMFSGTALLMDVHFPARPNGFGIVHVAGSGWFATQNYSAVPLKDVLERSVPALLEAGYTIFSVTHRATPTFAYPMPVEDVQRAVRFVRHNAEKYHINPEYLGGVGGSSGAHLLSLMGTLEDSGNGADPDPVNRQRARLQCIVARAAPLDLLQMAPTNIADALALFLGLRIASQTQAEGSQGYRKAWMASPINHVTADAAPFLLIHGDADEAVPLKQSEMMEEALRKVNVPAKLIRIAKGGHGPAFPGGQIPADLDAEIVTWLDTHLQKHASSR
jgi:acetyl esterase/lipase